MDWDELKGVSWAGLTTQMKWASMSWRRRLAGPGQARRGREAGMVGPQETGRKEMNRSHELPK